MALAKAKTTPLKKPAWLEPLLLILITGSALLLRFWNLGETPPGFHYDEALEALEAWRVLNWPGYHPVFFPGDFGLPAMFIYLDALGFRLFGQRPEIARSMAALVGTLDVLAVYALGRELTRLDERIPRALPLLAAAALAVQRWHLTFSRVAIEGILVPLFLTLILWTLLRGLRTNDLWTWWPGLGVLLGLSVYTYPAAWLFWPLLVVLLIYIRLFKPAWLAGRGRGLLLAALLALLVIAPLARHFITHPEQITARSGQVSLIDPALPISDNLAVLGKNLLAVLGMFSVAGDLDMRSNIPGRPALDWLSSIPLTLGAALALWRWKRPAFGSLLLALAAMLAATVLSQYAPNFRRAVGATSIVALLIGLGLAAILEWQPKPTPARRTWLPQALLVALILLGSAALTIRAYFVTWSQSPDLYYAYDEGLWDIAQYVQTLPAGQRIAISPRPAGDATLAFGWRQGPDVTHFDGRHALPLPGTLTALTQDITTIIIDHEDYRGNLLLADLFPQASPDPLFLDRNGQVYASVWQLPAGTKLRRQPMRPAQVSWPGFDLLGYDVVPDTVAPDDILFLQLWWQATAPIDTDWTVFTHLLGPVKTDGSPFWAGLDARPGQGSLPTTAWQPGDLILDEYAITLPADAPTGDYQIEIGLYDPAAGGIRALSSSPPAADHVIIGVIAVK